MAVQSEDSHVQNIKDCLPSRSLSPLAASQNARLPEEVWRYIATFYGYRTSEPLELDPKDYRDSLCYRLRGTCRALHEWCDHWEWDWVRIRHVWEIKHLLRRLDASANTRLITNFEVYIQWPWEIQYPHDWSLLGPPEEWVFADRNPKKREFFKKHVYPDAEEFLIDECVEDRFSTPEGWEEGPDGEGPDELVKNAVQLQEIMGDLIEQMPRLTTIHWSTLVIPMTSRICRALGRCEALREISLGPSGQFYSSLPQSPLWLLFENRKSDHPIETLMLGLEVLPSKFEFGIAGHYLDQPVPAHLEYLKNSHLLLKPLSIPESQYARYLDYPYEDGRQEATLNFVERPLAMVCRTLEASRGQLRQVQTTELQLAYITNFWQIWVQTALLGYKNWQGQRELNEAEDPRLDVIREMHECFRQVLESQQQDARILDSEKLLASFRAQKRLQPFAAMCEQDATLLQRMWQAFVSGYEKGLPDWDRPPIDSRSSYDRRNSGAITFWTVRNLYAAVPGEEWRN